MFELFALGRIVGGDENRVGRDRTPERFGFEGGNFESLFERDSVEIDIDDARSVVGIEKDIDSGELAHGAVDDVGLGGKHLDGDRDAGDGSEFHRAGGLMNTALQRVGRSCGLRRRIFLIIHHLQRASELLLSDE